MIKVTQSLMFMNHSALERWDQEVEVSGAETGMNVAIGLPESYSPPSNERWGAFVSEDGKVKIIRYNDSESETLSVLQGDFTINVFG